MLDDSPIGPRDSGGLHCAALAGRSTSAKASFLPPNHLKTFAMADKLSESAWTGFAKKQNLHLEDAALTKALTKLDKVDEANFDAWQDAIDGVAEQLQKQISALAKRKKELGDKLFGTAKDKLYELLDLANDLKKKARAAAAEESEEADTPALLTIKMVPLLRELRKGEAQMHALIGIAGKATAVLIMRRAIPTTRRKLLAEAMDGANGAKYFPAECLYEDKVLTFVVKGPGAGLAKKIRQALLEQVDLRLTVKVRGDDGEGEGPEGEDGGEEQAGARVERDAPPATGKPGEAVAGPSPEQLLYEQRLAALEAPLAQARAGRHPEWVRIQAVVDFASAKADGQHDHAAALKALGTLEKLLSVPVQVTSVPTASQSEAPMPTETAAAQPATRKPVPAGSYAAMKARAQPRLDAAKTRNPSLAQKVVAGIAAADALSAGGGDGAAIASLRASIKEFEEILATEHDKLLGRLDLLEKRATAIRWELKGATEPSVVKATVAALLKDWDFDTAKVSLDRFEKAIDQARPLDFDDIGVLQTRRAATFRKENARAARNTEQALMAAKRIIDDDGNLLLGAVLLKDPALANPSKDSKEEALKQRTEMMESLRDLPLVRVDDLAAVAEELAASKDAGLPQSVHALQMLQRLQSDKKVQTQLAAIKAPPDPATATTEEGKQTLRMAQNLIRTSLGLAPDAVLTDADAKRAAAAALLTQMRQGDVGSCFATASAIRVQRNKPQQFLADMAQILSTGKLTREIESPPGTKLKIEVPISREMIGRKVDVQRKGAKLHLSPKMVAALDALGLDQANHEKAIADAARRLRAERAVAKALGKIAGFLPVTHPVTTLSQTILDDLNANPTKTIRAAMSAALSGVKVGKTAAVRNKRRKLARDCCTDFDDPAGSDDFTPAELIEQITKTRPGPIAEGIQARAQAAYDSSDNNVLGRAWEYTLASMAEQVPEAATVNESMAAGIGAGTRTAAKRVTDAAVIERKLTGQAADHERFLGEHVAKAMGDRLAKELKVLYDPQVKSRSGAVSADGSSSKGGWSLFFRGKKVDGQAAFEDMVKTVLEECKQDFGPGTSKDWGNAFTARAKEIAETLKEQAETKDFRDAVIDGLVAKSGKDKDKFNTPWTMEVSGWEHAVQQVYENQATKPPAVMVKAYKYKDATGADKLVDDAEGLTHFVVDTLAALVNRLPDGDAAQSANVPVANSPHAFSLMPGSSSLQTVLKQGKPAAEVIADLKEAEGAKNGQRRAVAVPLKDLSVGFVGDAIASAATILPADKRASAMAAIRSHFMSLGVDSLPLMQFKAELKNAVRPTLSGVSISAADLEKWSNAGADRGVTASRVLDRVVPKAEYGALIDAAMRKLAVPETLHEPVRKTVMAAVSGDAVLREDLAKAVRVEMRKLGLGDDGQDFKTAREAYDALETDAERIAAFKAAGQTVATPAATFDQLTPDEAEVLRERGVCARLDAKLDKSLIEPRGLVFADTNWGDGNHMTHLSMVVNPLSDPPVIEMWKMNEDGSDARPQDGWIKGSNWRVYADPETYGGAIGAHEITTANGKTMLWEAYRAELQVKFNDCVATNQGDVGKLRGILDIADARFEEADFAAADIALGKLAEAMAPVELLARKIAKGLKPLQKVSDEVLKQLEGLKADAKAKKLKDPTDEQREATAGFEVLGRLILKLRSGIKTPKDLATFVADNRDALDYIDAQSPLGTLDVVVSLT